MIYDYDRRGYHRGSVLCRVDYADAAGRAWMGLVRDISLGGIFVDYAPGVTIGEAIVTAFALPGGPPLKLQAEVVRRHGQGAGLRFKGLSEQEVTRYPESLETYWAVLFTAWMGTRAGLPHTEHGVQPPGESIPWPQEAVEPFGEEGVEDRASP